MASFGFFFFFLLSLSLQWEFNFLPPLRAFMHQVWRILAIIILWKCEARKCVTQVHLRVCSRKWYKNIKTSHYKHLVVYLQTETGMAALVSRQPARYDILVLEIGTDESLCKDRRILIHSWYRCEIRVVVSLLPQRMRSRLSALFCKSLWGLLWL
jgi:hypothetical protein